MSNKVPEVISRADHETIVKTQQDRIEYLEHTVEKLKRLLYGRSSEKRNLDPTSPVQQDLFELEDWEKEVELPRPDEAEPPIRRSSRPRFPKNVEREVVEIQIPEEERSSSYPSIRRNA